MICEDFNGINANYAGSRILKLINNKARLV